MRILALDLGTKTGWATLNGSIQSGTQDLKGGRYDGGGMRFLRFRKWLCEMCDLIRPGAVVYEEVRRHIGVDAAHVYGGLLATMQLVLEERIIPYEGIPVGTWKKNLCGKGNADKQQVLSILTEKGYSPKSFDEADAIGVLLCAMETWRQK